MDQNWQSPFYLPFSLPGWKCVRVKKLKFWSIFEILKLFLTRKHFSVSPKSFIKSLNSFSFHSRGKWETQIIKSEAVYFASRCHPRAINGFYPRIFAYSILERGSVGGQRPFLSLWDQFHWYIGQLQPHLQIQPKIPVISVSNTNFILFWQKEITRTLKRPVLAYSTE